MNQFVKTSIGRLKENLQMRNTLPPEPQKGLEDVGLKGLSADRVGSYFLTVSVMEWSST